ncbi:Bifunctional solanapyrone synthase [Lachnellula cervina]|uniref:Bifunctional solanapyrone synthase n=1 Tax=Lachnellula cervina TaxID=1316786 RepID=A0A7D8UKJ3_9HELO|nr:Bifunctional solanapyrone synthase [Lachnellula cervina]
MTSPTELLANLKIESKEAEEYLSRFASLSDEENKTARPAAIEKLFPLLFGDIAAIESSESFAQLRQKPWSTNCYLSPAAILTPTTTTQVSQILALVKFLGATFSIRGGGHLQNPGFTSNDGGVVISLCHLTGITLSEDKKTATIGAGLNWLQVYKELHAHDLTVTGGRVPSVGVPGLLLGGGLSFQNSEHGFSCMGVVNYEVVLADSKIVNANAKENPDLFWALKGGCANFGIVTSFEMITVPNKVWAEARLYPPTQNLELIEALMKYHEGIEKDNKATLIFHATSQATLLVFFYTAPVDNPAVFKPYYEIPFLMKLIEPGCRTVYEVMQGIANVLQAETLSHDMRTMTSLPDLEMYKAVEEVRSQQVQALAAAGVEDVLLTMVFQPIASGAINACEAAGGNPLGLKAQNHNWFLVMADWKNPADEETVRQSVRTIVDKGEEISKKNGTYIPFKYANYASRDQNPLATYGPENLTKLKEIALKYDADEVFQKLQNGGWLLSRT